jgi:prolyl-tRNA editing enzyme YbaK/EbsC (Cys-tRNA(Pro) deacylase)
MKFIHFILSCFCLKVARRGYYGEMTVLLPIVQDALERGKTPYGAMTCDPELADTAAFCQAYGFTEDQSANTIIVVGKTEPLRYAACVVLATTKLDVNKAVCKLLNTKKASFAAMDQALRLSGMEYGGVTIFGLPDSIPVYIDAAVMNAEKVVMGGGNRSSKVIITTEALARFPGVTVVPDLAKPRNS